jgi:hypothetical protein
MSAETLAYFRMFCPGCRRSPCRSGQRRGGCLTSERPVSVAELARRGIAR